jgi:hypothetical protein
MEAYPNQLYEWRKGVLEKVILVTGRGLCRGHPLKGRPRKKHLSWQKRLANILRPKGMLCMATGYAMLFTICK